MIEAKKQTDGSRRHKLKLWGIVNADFAYPRRTVQTSCREPPTPNPAQTGKWYKATDDVPSKTRIFQKLPKRQKSIIARAILRRADRNKSSDTHLEVPHRALKNATTVISREGYVEERRKEIDLEAAKQNRTFIVSDAGPREIRWDKAGKEIEQKEKGGGAARPGRMHFGGNSFG